MNIYVSHSNSMDFMNELYIPIRNSSLNQIHRIVLPHEDGKEPYPSKDFLQNDCHYLIAECSESSTGFGIELGWADAFCVPTVCVHRKGKKVSSSVKIVCENFIEYEDSNDLIEKLEAYFSKIK